MADPLSVLYINLWKWLKVNSFYFCSITTCSFCYEELRLLNFFFGSDQIIQLNLNPECVALSPNVTLQSPLKTCTDLVDIIELSIVLAKPIQHCVLLCFIFNFPRKDITFLIVYTYSIEFPLHQKQSIYVIIKFQLILPIIAIISNLRSP